MKYKVGDKVRVRENLKVGSILGGLKVTSDLRDLGGTVLTIESVFPEDELYAVEGGDCYHYWASKMLEPAFPKWIYKWYQKLSIAFSGYTIKDVAVYCIASQGFGYNFDRKVFVQHQVQHQLWEAKPEQIDYVGDHWQEIIESILNGEFDDYLKSHNPKYEVPP